MLPWKYVQVVVWAVPGTHRRPRDVRWGSPGAPGSETPPARSRELYACAPWLAPRPSPAKTGKRRAAGKHAWGAAARLHGEAGQTASAERTTVARNAVGGVCAVGGASGWHKLGAVEQLRAERSQNCLTLAVALGACKRKS